MFKLFKTARQTKAVVNAIKDSITKSTLEPGDPDRISAFIEKKIKELDDPDARDVAKVELYSFLYGTLQKQLNGVSGHEVQQHFKISQPVYVKMIKARTKKVMRKMK